MIYVITRTVKKADMAKPNAQHLAIKGSSL